MMVDPDLNHPELRFVRAQRTQAFVPYVVAGGYGLEILVIFTLYISILAGHSGSALSGSIFVALVVVFSSLFFGTVMFMLHRNFALARLINELDETDRVLADGQRHAARVQAFSKKLERQTRSG